MTDMERYAFEGEMQEQIREHLEPHIQRKLRYGHGQCHVHVRNLGLLVARELGIARRTPLYITVKLLLDDDARAEVTSLHGRKGCPVAGLIYRLEEE